MLTEIFRLDFTAEKFRNLAPRDRADICIQLAERAHEFGMGAPAIQQTIFMSIANQWLQLADLISKEPAKG